MEGHAASIKRRIGSSSRRNSKVLSGGGSSTVTDESVYAYALRVAYLAYLSRPKVPPLTTATHDVHNKRFSMIGGGVGGSNPNRPNSVSDHLDNLSSTVSSGLSQFHELFKDDKKGSKSLRIPKELIKALQTRLGMITSGQDPNPVFQDKYLLRNLELFYNLLQQSAFRQQFKNVNSKIEDLVIIYVKTALGELKNVKFPPPTTLHDKLDQHSSIFVGILKECLTSKECAGVASPEMISRLDSYQARFSGNKGSSNNSTSANGSVDEMNMVKTVQAIFKVSKTQLQKDITAIKKQCTEEAAIEDLRTCINHVNRGSPFPAPREDFESEEAYNNWKAIELKTLTDILTTMVRLKSFALKQNNEVISTILSKERSAAPDNTRRATFTVTNTEVVNDTFRQYETQRHQGQRHSVSPTFTPQQLQTGQQERQLPQPDLYNGSSLPQGHSSNVPLEHHNSPSQGEQHWQQQTYPQAQQSTYGAVPPTNYPPPPGPFQPDQYPPSSLPGNYSVPPISYPPPFPYTGVPYPPSQQQASPAQYPPYQPPLPYQQRQQQPIQTGFCPPSPNLNQSPLPPTSNPLYSPLPSNAYSSPHITPSSAQSGYPWSGSSSPVPSSPQIQQIPASVPYSSENYPSPVQNSPRQLPAQPNQSVQYPLPSSQYPPVKSPNQHTSGQHPPFQNSPISRGISNEGLRPISVQLPSPVIENSSLPPKSPPISDISSERSSEGTYGAFTYIPPNPKIYYKVLLNRCLDYELSIRSPEDISVKLLSKNTNDLLNDCVLRWRVPSGYRALLYLDAVRVKYDDHHELVNLDHIREGIHILKDSIKKRDVSNWTISDRKELVSVYWDIHGSLLRFLWEALQHLYKIKTSTFEPAFFLLNEIYESELFRQAFPDISASYETIREGVGKVAVTEFQKRREEVFAQQEENELIPLIDLSQWIQTQIEKLSKKYPMPLMGQVNILSLVIEKQVPLFTLDMENLAADILNRVKAGDEEGIPVELIFDLYREVLNIKLLYESHCIGAKFNFSIDGWFAPHVRKWLEMTDAKTPEWVHSAISVDEFKPVSTTDKHSSSVVDLFTSFNQTVEYLKKLQWPNEYQYARFMTSLSRTISKALEQYCNKMEELFCIDMSPLEETVQETTKQSAWYVRAKTAIASDEKIIPFDFKPELCIKLNNIEAGREQLDKLYNSMDVDYLSEVIRDAGPAVPEKIEKTRYLFTIKIVLAENLAALDANGYSDPYCVLTDEKGKRLAETRVIYETLNPRWDEAFDITIETSEQMRWVAATVWDRDQLGADDVCGRAYFRLDPQFFGDYLAHDIWLDLEKQGRLLLHISMEGEKDDIQFYFGKAFRTLKRTESDMARSIVDRISPFLRQCLSRGVLHKLLKPSSGIGGFFSDKKKEPLTLEEIETAIHPLFDYFDTNLSTLNQNLSEVVVTMVMIKVWKEIELVMEELLIPPLSDRPSDMKALNEFEVDTVYKWLKFLKDYLHGQEGDEAIPISLLENSKYHELMATRYFYDWDTEKLMQEYLSLQKESSLTPVKKPANKSVMNQRSRATIKKHQSEKNEHPTAQNNSEVILRILRMRSGTKFFLKQQSEERVKRLQKKLQPNSPSSPNVDEVSEENGNQNTTTIPAS
ncbi:hypothetical protein G9A89_018249 [Geosiphon pyriformis]|nr:hypothetical protein G9A89_018249 [Geosiphon pyriformis]